MTDYEYAASQGKKALAYIREAPKVNGKLKDRRLAKAAGNLLRAFRAKEAKALVNAAAEVFAIVE